MTYADSISSTATIKTLTPVLDYTDKVDGNYYEYSVKSKEGSINFHVTAQLGHVVPFGSTSGVHDKCRLQIKDSIGTTELDLGTLPDNGVVVTILPIAEKDGGVQTLIDLKDTQYTSITNSKVVNESCSISNSISITNSVRWLGNLTIGQEKRIILSDGDELYITLFRDASKK